MATPGHTATSTLTSLAKASCTANPNQGMGSISWGEDLGPVIQLYLSPTKALTLRGILGLLWGIQLSSRTSYLEYLELRKI